MWGFGEDWIGFSAHDDECRCVFGAERTHTEVEARAQSQCEEEDF